MDAGTRVQRIGCGLALAVVIPVLGTVLFGIVGFVIGLVIAAVLAVGIMATAFRRTPPAE